MKKYAAFLNKVNTITYGNERLASDKKVMEGFKGNKSKGELIWLKI